jgi:AcrR family transcriptional regulator
MTSTRNMTRRSPQQRRSQEMCDRIVEAAARVFADEGYARGTTNRIAEEAGVSIGSLYQYYPNKDVLLAELVRRHIRDGADEIAKRLVAVDVELQSVEERTRMFVEATVALHRDDVALHRVLFEESPRPPDVVEELRQFETATVAAVEQLIANDPVIHVRDTHMAAYITVSTIESVTHHYASAHPHDADWDAFTDELVRLVAGYLHSARLAT